MFEERTYRMNQISQNRTYQGAAFMVLAGITFAIINAITFTITSPAEYGGLGFKPQSDTFWQYAIALVFSLPFLMRTGGLSFKTKQPIPHIIRVVLSYRLLSLPSRKACLCGRLLRSR
jgi:hypothetical protein